MDKELEHIIKYEGLITCDHKECDCRGEMWYCYLNQERKCGIYISDYVERKRTQINHTKKLDCEIDKQNDM